MTLNEEILTKFLEDLKDDLISQQSTEGMRASGRSANELKVLTGGFSGLPYLTGPYWWRYQFRDTGRRPGAFPKLDNIIKWIEVKGIDIGDLTVKQMAYLIGKKIASSGTSIYRREKGIKFDQTLRKHLTPAVKRIATDIRQQVSKGLREVVR